ncbi:MAG: YgeY family selenium metabolism-linked hydrolase [Chloroflexi bacterium]|nr:MAG: YgeY family selenium metabolism-linked hydrolase [Chloroflexota bacterium]
MPSLSPRDEKQLITFLRDLIRIPSLSSQEGPLAERIAREMRDLGFSKVYIDKVGNVVGRIGTGESPVLLFDGHMDTVDVGDASAWSKDPYGAEVEGDFLYGLGAADMKGGLAAMVYGLGALIKSGLEIPGTVYLVGVVQEEPCEGMAVKAFLEEENVKPDYVVIGEPSNLQVVCGHRGRMGIKITTYGHSCHASTPEQGENAIYAAARIIFGIELLAPQLLSDAFLGRGSIAVTWIESRSPSQNAIPSICTFYVDRRLTLGETEAKALAEIQSIIAREDVRAEVKVNEYDVQSYTGYSWKVREYYPAWLISHDHPLVLAGVRAVEKTLGVRPALTHWKFSTDGVYTMGVAGIPTIGFGPGEEKCAHTPDERVRISDVIAAANVYANLVLEVMRLK